MSRHLNKSLPWLAIGSLAVGCAFAQSSADFAIFNDGGPNAGAWDPSIDGIKAVLDRFGYSYEEVTPEQLNDGLVLADYYRVFYMPGGWAGFYNQNLTPTGDQAIRDFVAGGGGYMGMCAGAFYASDIVQWKPTESEPLEIYDYPSDMFLGTARGAVLSLAPWELGEDGGFPVLPAGGVMTSLDIDETLLPLAPNILENVLYYGGPKFLPPPGGWGDIQIIAEYIVPGSTDDGEPAMIMVPYGEGQLFLSALHPEVSFDFQTETYFFDPANQRMLRGVIAYLLDESDRVDFANMGLAPKIGKSAEVTTLPGVAYQMQRSLDGGTSWENVGDVFLARSTTTQVFVEGTPPPNCLFRAVSR